MTACGIPGRICALVERLAAGTRLPVIAEGRIRSAHDVRQAFRAGAYAVVVGRRITGIDKLVRQFVDATPLGSGRDHGCRRSAAPRAADRWCSQYVALAARVLRQQPQ